MPQQLVGQHQHAPLAEAPHVVFDQVVVAEVVEPEQRNAAVARRRKVFLEAADAAHPDVLLVGGDEHGHLLPHHHQDPGLVERRPDPVGQLRRVVGARVRVARKAFGREDRDAAGVCGDQVRDVAPAALGIELERRRRDQLAPEPVEAEQRHPVAQTRKEPLLQPGRRGLVVTDVHDGRRHRVLGHPRGGSTRGRSPWTARPVGFGPPDDGERSVLAIARPFMLAGTLTRWPTWKPTSWRPAHGRRTGCSRPPGRAFSTIRNPGAFRGEDGAIDVEQRHGRGETMSADAFAAFCSSSARVRPVFTDTCGVALRTASRNCQPNRPPNRRSILPVIRSERYFRRFTSSVLQRIPAATAGSFVRG